MRPKLRKKYVCTACRRKFGTSNAAWTHVAFTHDQVVQANVEILCCDCKTLFPDETDLEKHVVEIHSAPPLVPEEDIRPANDWSLGLDELNLSSLNEPLRVITDSPSPEKELEENIEGHTKTVTQCKSFKLHCRLCKKKFMSENVLWTHVTFKHGSKSQNFTPQFSCDSCKSIFDSLEEFKKHSLSSFLSEPHRIVHKSLDINHYVFSEHCSGMLNVDKSIEHKDSIEVSCCDAKEKTTSGKSDENNVHLNFNACDQVEALNPLCVPKNEHLANTIDDVPREPTELLNSSNELIAVIPEFSTEYGSQADNRSESSSIESHLDNHRENNLAIDGEQDCGNTTPKIASSPGSNTVILAQNIEEDEPMIVTEEDEESEDEYEGRDIASEIVLLSSMLTNELLSDRVNFLENKVVSLQKYMQDLVDGMLRDTEPAVDQAAALDEKVLAQRSPSIGDPNTILEEFMEPLVISEEGYDERVCMEVCREETVVDTPFSDSLDDPEENKASTEEFLESKTTSRRKMSRTRVLPTQDSAEGNPESRKRSKSRNSLASA